MISATIQVTRDDENIDVIVDGLTEHFTSHNPNEAGLRVVCCEVYWPKNIVLTKEETERAFDALSREI